MKKSKVYALCEGAIMVALATALSYVKLMELPQGGSVCIGMLPLFIYFYRWDWKHSFLAAFAYGLLQLIFDGAYAWGPTSMLLDYVLAFTALGVATFFRKMKGGLYLGATVACVCRFLVHFISGVTIYRINEPTELFNSIYTNPWLYSAVYNGSYVLIDLVLCLVILAVLSTPMRKYLRGDDLKAMQGIRCAQKSAHRHGVHLQRVGETNDPKILNADFLNGRFVGIDTHNEFGEEQRERGKDDRVRHHAEERHAIGTVHAAVILRSVILGKKQHTATHKTPVSREHQRRKLGAQSHCAHAQFAKRGDHHGIHHAAGGGQQVLKRNRDRNDRHTAQKFFPRESGTFRRHKESSFNVQSCPV